ncbi:hypothetical protein CDV36_002230 [Fusarium kuroshium]|uniref:G domain-containing protein n=1 Tax=Fusarium kuroshium TaxID=2010991 RepID=A0A3M2SLL2_9HYPO|nr:hypothetical protein CDV36_002230 [Fusarium kuroshium]
MTLTSSKPMAPPSGPNKADPSSPSVGLPDDGTPINDVHGGEDSTHLDDDCEATDSEESLDDKPDPEAVGETAGTWSFKGLSELIKKAKGAASKPVIEFIRHHLRGTKLIFVMGQTGTGKTSILQELTGIDLGVGHTSKSGTRQYQVCPAIIHGNQYLLVDTAGFGAADLNNMKNFHDIMGCLTALGPFVTVAGVLFVYGFPKERLESADLQTVRWIECFCGPEFFSNITIVTSKWDRNSNEDSFPEHWQVLGDMMQDPDLQRIINPPARFHGGHVYHHGFPQGSATVDSFEDILSRKRHPEKRGDALRDLIHSRYANAKPPQLQIFRELEEKTSLYKTEAAKVLQADTTESEIRIGDNRAILVSQDSPETQNTEKENAKEGTAKQKSKESTEPGSNAGKDGAKKSGKGQTPPSPDGPSWMSTIIEWLVIGRNASEYFRKARSQGHESTNRKGASQGPVWSILSSIKDWWFGS